VCEHAGIYGLNRQGIRNHVPSIHKFQAKENPQNVRVLLFTF